MDRDIYEMDVVSPYLVEWVGRFMFRIPERFRQGLELEQWRGELHATWDSEEKTVAFFFTHDRELKIYRERRVADRVVSHELVAHQTLADAIETLEWFGTPGFTRMALPTKKPRGRPRVPRGLPEFNQPETSPAAKPIDNREPTDV